MIPTKFAEAVALACLLAAAGLALPLVTFAEDPPIGCSASDHIDGSDANSARRLLEEAGYSKIVDLKKGCDNVWHGVGIKDGKPARVAVSPKGKILPEGN